MGCRLRAVGCKEGIHLPRPMERRAAGACSCARFRALGALLQAATARAVVGGSAWGWRRQGGSKLVRIIQYHRRAGGLTLRTQRT